jgi:hypothetical protein
MEIEFFASLANIGNTLAISGEGDSHIRLDIPESELPNALKIILFKGQSFKVRITNEVTENQRQKREGSQSKLSKKSSSVPKR